MMADARTPTKDAADPPRTPAQSIKDTIESIVVAFILAFVFRAFIVEAFVIPTGSMAATLYGEHGTHTCTSCGYEYAYGVSRDQRTEVLQPLQSSRSGCPNCGFEDQIVTNEWNPPDSGDRILVLKWPLDLGIRRLGPKRWDVTVFKDPANGQDNFIKRLVGCPNEILELIDGDVYAASLAAASADHRVPPGLVQKMDQIRHLNYLRLTLPPLDSSATQKDIEERSNINRRIADLQREILPKLEPFQCIQRKTADVTRAQDSLWFTVFDQDYLPNASHGKRWRVDPPGSPSGWDTSTRIVRFNGIQRSRESIRLDGTSSTDEYAYNFSVDRLRRGRPDAVVRDRRIRCLVTPLEGDGRLELLLTKYDHEFRAEFDFGAGTVSLTMTTRSDDAPPRSNRIGLRKLAMPLGKPLDVTFANVDYRVSLCINGQEMLATDDAVYRPDIAWLRRRPNKLPAEAGRDDDEPVAQISAERMNLELRHLVVERDVYYTNVSLCSEPISGKTGKRNPFCPEGLGGGESAMTPGWATEGNPILLREGEYLMLGDNSPASKDSRLWWEVGPHLVCRGEAYQVGTVPEDQLIGRAFFVYWPSGLRRPWTGRFGVVPNVGRMRWIR